MNDFCVVQVEPESGVTFRSKGDEHLVSNRICMWSAMTYIGPRFCGRIYIVVGIQISRVQAELRVCKIYVTVKHPVPCTNLNSINFPFVL